MKILTKDLLGNLPLIGKPCLRVPIVGLVVDKEKNLDLLEKFIDPTPEIWDEIIKDSEIILRVPMDNWDGEIIPEYVRKFVEKEGIV